MTDEECVQRCLDGQREDFRILVERYQRSVYGFLWLRLRNHTLAEEGAQEAFVRAFTHLAKLKTPAGFHAWILGIAGKIALELRREGLRLEVSDSLPEPEVQPINLLDQVTLQKAIATLSPLSGQVILLRFFDQLSCQEIAARLDMPLGTVTKTLSRAYIQLRQELETKKSSIAVELSHELS